MQGLHGCKPSLQWRTRIYSHVSCAHTGQSNILDMPRACGAFSSVPREVRAPGRTTPPPWNGRTMLAVHVEDSNDSKQRRGHTGSAGERDLQTTVPTTPIPRLQSGSAGECPLPRGTLAVSCSQKQAAASTSARPVCAHTTFNNMRRRSDEPRCNPTVRSSCKAAHAVPRSHASTIR